MLVASTKTELSKIIKKLSYSMECGAKEQVYLKDCSLINYVTKSLMSESLSLIDAYEEGRGIVITIENRFGRKCKE
ncbi:MAG: hypothetical protein J7L12_02855 [Desulfurococcales archaeon]|nr:hypothetical protein [Desulfurococcales archaeon]